MEFCSPLATNLSESLNHPHLTIPRQKRYPKDNVLDAILEAHDSVSLKKAAQRYGIPAATLSDRSRESHQHAQPSTRLTAAEEAHIIEWILRQESLGHTPSYSALASVVSSLLQAKSNLKALGRH